jgi:guanine deaminase
MRRPYRRRAMIIQGLLLSDAHVPPKPGWLAIEAGRIVELGEGEPRERPDIASESGAPPFVICPGFIDAHLHLSQFDVIGYDGMQLLDWLERVIFPAETRWSDETWAAKQVRDAYAQLVRAGTLGFAAFLTSHFHGYVHCVRAGHHLPLRAIVGQVLMDRHAPAGLLGYDLTRLATSERARVTCSVNPRFAVTCSDELLATAGERAASGAVVHTHLAESRAECELVHRLFPDDPHYAGLYDRHGLLTPRTLLAHAVHLSEEEWALIARRQSVIVHCPTANLFLRSGMFDLDAARRHNVRLALGSDVAAGPDLSMPRVARAMIENAKTRAMSAGAWNLITRGNADALGWHDAGRIEIGAAADLLVLRLPFDPDEHLLSRTLYSWRDDYIAHQVVSGRIVKIPAD